MNTDNNLRNFVAQITDLRAYDDDSSIILRLRMIEELHTQLKNIHTQRYLKGGKP